ncbi:hypothetical protein LshimejAT787_0702560 [Lyophyllum shimeji]|uniref:Uncharacterized protein n=1 Tax=Lyophyllum shimeji TaxID=47721 RepID=A0A9P3UR00_LYOSH|nr:hypothetical protein LshimejAT787_0702560 [Lyophyllum shimeji]
MTASFRMNPERALELWTQGKRWWPTRGTELYFFARAIVGRHRVARTTSNQGREVSTVASRDDGAPIESENLGLPFVPAFLQPSRIAVTSEFNGSENLFLFHTPSRTLQGDVMHQGRTERLGKSWGVRSKATWLALDTASCCDGYEVRGLPGAKWCLSSTGVSAPPAVNLRKIARVIAKIPHLTSHVAWSRLKSSCRASRCVTSAHTRFPLRELAKRPIRTLRSDFGTLRHSVSTSTLANATSHLRPTFAFVVDCWSQPELPSLCGINNIRPFNDTGILLGIPSLSGCPGAGLAHQCYIEPRAVLITFAAQHYPVARRLCEIAYYPFSSI